MALTRPSSCLGCALYQKGNGFSQASGTGSNQVLLVAEALGHMEAMQGIPFVGEAGAQLNRTLARSRHRREDFRISNCVWCQPPNNWLEGAPWEQGALAHCRPNLDSVIQQMQPKVIVPMGGVALRSLLGIEGIMDRRAPKRGYVYQEAGRYYVPTMHPSYVMQGNAKLTGVQAFDLARAVDVAKNGFTEPECNYLENPTDAVCEQFVREARTACANGAWLTADIETEMSTDAPEDELTQSENANITCISFAFRPNHAISIPWCNHNLGYIQELLLVNAPFITFWNEKFDVPRIKAKGLKIGPKIVCSMYMWHFLQSDLPKGLGFVASLFTQLKEWKSLSNSYPEFYSCLSEDSRVVLADGTTRSIAKIVNNKEKVIVKTLDSAGNMSVANVIDWHKNHVQGQTWLKIKAEAQRQPLYLTPDHKVLVRDKKTFICPCHSKPVWKEAKDLIIGDELALPRSGSEDFIHGTLLGDGSVEKRGRLSVTHGRTQEAYLSRIANHFGVKVYKVKDGIIQFESYYSSRIGHRSLQAWVPLKWRRLFYPQGKKVFVVPSMASLAIWYCDDGTLKDRGPRFCIRGYSEEDKDNILNYFDTRFGRRWVSYYNGCSSVALKGEGAENFFLQTREFIPPEMYYKLPKDHREKYNGWLELYTPIWSPITEIADYKTPAKRRRDDWRYCITVDGPEQRFFALGGLVHNCRDSDAAITCAYGIRDCLIREGRFESFLRHHTQLEPILTEMGRSGITIDRGRKAAFMQRMRNEKTRLDGEIQTAVPVELRPFKARRKISADAILGEPCRSGSDEVWDYDRITGEWGERSPFSCGSSKQVVKYMRSKGHPVPKNYKTGRDTTGADEIERLAKKYPQDPLYRIIVESRETDKVISQYLNGYEPDSDGRLRTTFTQKPSTWRLASESPNIQNVRRRWHLANEYRRMFVAAPGCVLAEFDYRAIEALITGFYAGDSDYIRAAKLGVHAILQAHVMGYKPLSDTWAVLPDDVVRAELKKLKKQDKKLYDMCKTIVHMSNYLGTPKKILMDNADQFKKMKEVEDLQNIYFSTIGKKIRRWQSDTLQEAHRNGLLNNVFGNRHYYYDVLAWDSKTRAYTMHGSDAKRCMSFLPQSTAAGVIKEAMLRLGTRFFYRRALRWMIHDSLLFELPKDRLLDQRLLAIKQEMERPVPQLGGLSIEVECAVGPSWGEMAEWAF